MNATRFAHGDADVVRLRTIITAIDRELSLLPRSASGERAGGDALRASWADLVEVLALGPAPETRLCPICGHIAMRAATRCGHCWSKLSPLAAAASDAPGAPVVGPPCI
jgi:hypothetical protein